MTAAILLLNASAVILLGIAQRYLSRAVRDMARALELDRRRLLELERRLDALDPMAD